MVPAARTAPCRPGRAGRCTVWSMTRGLVPVVLALALTACTPGGDPTGPGPSDPTARGAPVRVCANGTSGGAPGPAEQARPDLGTGGFAATMDTRAGRVVVLDSTAATWTLDVCTNTWERVPTRGTAPATSTTLVYDAQSDLTYAFGALHVVRTLSLATGAWSEVADTTAAPGIPVRWDWAVLDAGRRRVLFFEETTGDLATYGLTDHRWRAVPHRGESPRGAQSLATVDPGSGRVLVHFQHGDTLLAPGRPTPSGTTPFTARTWSLDPQTWRWTQLPSPTPVLRFGHLSPEDVLTYDEVGDRVVAFSMDELFVLDPTSDEWSPALPGPGGTHLSHHLVDDPVTGRVILLGGDVWTPAAGWRTATGVWAYDVTTNTWAEVVPQVNG